MNFDCWVDGVWAEGSWVEGSWCPESAPPISIHFGGGFIEEIDMRRLRREDEEIIVLKP